MSENENQEDTTGELEDVEELPGDEGLDLDESLDLEEWSGMMTLRKRKRKAAGLMGRSL